MALSRRNRTAATALIFMVTATAVAANQDSKTKLSWEESFTPSDYLNIIILTLGRTHAALTNVNKKATDPSMVERMVSVKNASIEMKVAGGLLKEYASAKGELVRSSATAVIESYDFMSKSLDLMAMNYEKLDAATSMSDLPEIRKLTADAKVMYQQSSSILLDAINLAFASTIVPDPKDPENRVAINMTSTEKAELLKKLDSRFGPALSKEATDDTGPLNAAKLLKAQLEKGWKHAK